MVTRAEQQTGFSPGIYEIAVVMTVQLEGEPSDQSGQLFVAELPMELRDKVLLIHNDLTVSKPVVVSEESHVANDLKGLGVSVPIRLARALAGSLLAMLLIAGGIYASRVRGRVGSGELARIQLRYGSLIVPVTGTTPNGAHPIDVASMADLVRLARRADQMVFYDQRSPSEHWFFVPDGGVRYQYKLSDKGPHY
jgi:hypothetical protein